MRVGPPTVGIGVLLVLCRLALGMAKINGSLLGSRNLIRRFGLTPPWSTSAICLFLLVS